MLSDEIVASFARQAIHTEIDDDVSGVIFLGFTPREVEVIGKIEQGKINKTIAYELIAAHAANLPASGQASSASGGRAAASGTCASASSSGRERHDDTRNRALAALHKTRSPL